DLPQNALPSTTPDSGNLALLPLPRSKSPPPHRVAPAPAPHPAHTPACCRSADRPSARPPSRSSQPSTRSSSPSVHTGSIVPRTYPTTAAQDPFPSPRRRTAPSAPHLLPTPTPATSA